MTALNVIEHVFHD